MNHGSAILSRTLLPAPLFTPKRFVAINIFFSPDCKGRIVVSYALYVAAFARCPHAVRRADEVPHVALPFADPLRMGLGAASIVSLRNDALLSIHLSRCRRLRRQLQYCCRPDLRTGASTTRSAHPEIRARRDRATGLSLLTCRKMAV
jgi:hypothetical protein